MRWFFLVGLVLLFLMAGVGLAAEEPKKKDTLFAFGESASYRKCLQFTVMQYKDGTASMASHDWVTITTENKCTHPVGAVRMALVLIDTEGMPYGADLWLLQPSMVLKPGGIWQDRYPIPDGAGRYARFWAVRITEAKGFPRQRRPVVTD